jgi:hypothetical protein
VCSVQCLILVVGGSERSSLKGPYTTSPYVVMCLGVPDSTSVTVDSSSVEALHIEVSSLREPTSERPPSDSLSWAQQTNYLILGSL